MATRCGKRSSAVRLLLVLMLAACARRPAFNPERAYAEGRLLEERGELQSAADLAASGLAHFKDRPDSEWNWRFRLLEAEAWLLKVQPSGAAPLLGDDASPAGIESQTRMLYDRGWLAYEGGDYHRASALLDHALADAEAHGLGQLAVEIRLRRGATRSRLRDAAGSASDFSAALEQSRKLADHYWEAVALANAATALMNQGRYDEAVAGYTRVLDLSRPIQSKSFDSRASNNLGYCYLQLGQPERAASYFDRGQELAKETGIALDLHFSLGRMGDWYADQGQPARALGYYERAYEIAGRAQNNLWTGRWLYRLSSTALDLGDVARAADWNRRAEASDEHVDNAIERQWPLINEARLAEAARDPRRAEARYRSVLHSIALLHDNSEPELMLEAHGRLANLLAGMHRNSEAEAEFRQAMALADASSAELQRDDSRIAFFATLLHIYRDYVDFLMLRHREADGLRAAESCRARVLTARLGKGDAVRPGSSPRDYRQLAASTGHVFLSYWLAPERSFLWVATASRLTAFTLPPQAKIEALASAYAAEIEDLHDPLAEASESGRALSQALLAPAAALIPPGSRVAVVPDGALYALNFETLPAPGASASPHYWVEDVRLTVIPSLELAARARPAASPDPRSLLAIGDPTPPDAHQYPRLAHATEELDAVRRIFPAAVVRSGAAAAPDAYAAARPERFNLIHFAAHADANSAQPLDSAIILSASGDRFKLYARDIMAVPIQADLVTLSACRSAGSRTYGGEGLVGFAWAFLEAGARQVVAGLWEVDDRSTALLMKDFYAGIGQGSSPSEALRHAKLQLRESAPAYHKPYYWGPFEVISDSLGN